MELLILIGMSRPRCSKPLRLCTSTQLMNGSITHSKNTISAQDQIIITFIRKGPKFMEDKEV